MVLHTTLQYEMFCVRYVINGEINDKYIDAQHVDILYTLLLVYIFCNERAFECIGLDSETLINKVVGLGCDWGYCKFWS